MTNRPTSREELYERIRRSSKDEVILEEMVRLGFWPREGAQPHDPADEIRRRGEIHRELSALQTETARLGNIEALKSEARRRGLQASRDKQKETKARRERERVARAEAWKQRQAKEIFYLGAGVSGGLSHTEANESRLVAQGLPVLRTADDLARAMGVSVPELRFLGYARDVSAVSHYVRFTIPKKTGGERLISAPMRRLKAAQHWVLSHVLERVAVHDVAHGFREERSIVSNARPHVGAGVVVNVDLKDFFPTITFARAKGVFRGLGYGDQVATLLALLSTEPDVEEVELDGRRWFVAVGPRKLPQGAPTSPAITNILCRRLDRRLNGAAKKLGFTYTRYADDLTFSGAVGSDVGRMLHRVRWLTKLEGFVPHEKKTRVLRRGRRQEVTGVVVNERLSVDRATLKRFRALLFHIEKDGPAGKTWGASADLFGSVIGFANYVAMVEPDKGKKLLAEARALAQKHGWRPPPRFVPPAPVAAPAAAKPSAAPAAPPPVAAPAGETPPDAPADAPKKKKWWQIF